MRWLKWWAHIFSYRYVIVLEHFVPSCFSYKWYVFQPRRFSDLRSKFDLKCIFISVSIEALDRNLPSLWDRLVDGTVSVSLLLFRRNGHHSFSRNSGFGMGFALVFVSDGTATIFEIDDRILTHWFPFFWIGSHVLHNGQLFWCKLFSICYAWGIFWKSCSDNVSWTNNIGPTQT